MASKIKKGLETANVESARALARAQIAVDKVLWGSRAVTNTPRADDRTQTAEQKNADAGKRLTQRIGSNARRKANRLAERGVFQALEDLLAADLCNILTHIYSQVGRPKSSRSETPTSTEKTLYAIQDKALAVQKAIDTFTTYPDRLIGRYITGGGFDPITQNQARQQTNTPTNKQPTVTETPTTQGGRTTNDINGTQSKKFNLVKLVEFVQASFSDVLSIKDVQGRPIFQPSDKEVLSAVPEMQGALNFMNDLSAGLSRYTDYRNISNEELQKALKMINNLRAICVLIQNLSIKNPIDLLNLVPPTAIQAQLQKLQQTIDPADLVPFIKRINDAVNSFIKGAEIIQGVITKGQVVVRIAITLVQYLKGVISFLELLMVTIPSLFTTVGVGVNISKQLRKLDRILDDLIDILKQINALIGLAISTIRYLLANGQALRDRVTALLNALSNCDAIKDSAVLLELQQTVDNLNNLETTLQSILNKYDNNVTPKKATFGGYTIQVIDEEVVDEGIANVRRRGIALDNKGLFVLQSDLTFATDLAIIVQEVKIKLIAAGLVQPGLTPIDPVVDVVTDSLSLLEESDLTVESLNFSDLDLQDDFGEGVNLSTFVDGLSGGKRLRKRVRIRTDAIKTRFRNRATADRATVSTVPRSDQTQQTPTNALSKYKVQIYENNILKQVYDTSAASVDDAIKQAKNKLDPNGKYPNWKYVAKRV